MAAAAAAVAASATTASGTPAASTATVAAAAYTASAPMRTATGRGTPAAHPSATVGPGTVRTTAVVSALRAAMIGSPSRIPASGTWIRKAARPSIAVRYTATLARE